jgi:MoaA/NifB/PqqE/SkfB family radical SAM enzyme
MIQLLSKKKLFSFFQKESLKTGLHNLPFIFFNKVSAYSTKKLTPITKGSAGFPVSIHLYLTEICNLNCKMCFLKQIKSKTNTIELDIIKKVVGELIYLRPRYTLTGGEPFLYPEIKEIIKHIKAKGLYLSIVTNGTLIENFAETLVHSGVDKLNISIDGSPEKHDTIRRTSGAFSKTLKGIQAINYEKKRQNKKKPILSLYSLLNTDIDEDFIFSFAQENSFKEINFLNFLFINSEDLRNLSNNWGTKPHYWKGAVIDNKDFKIPDSLIERIKSHNHDPKYRIDIKFTPDIKETDLNKYYNKDKDFLNQFKGRCSAPWTSATIKPPAKVEICPDLTIGDLTINSFSEIWNGKKAKSIRKEIFKGNMLPICSGCCNYYV